MSASTIVPLALKTSLMLMVLGIGLQSTMRDATYLARHPAQAGRAFLSMSVLMPVLAVILATSFELTSTVSFALVALALSPLPPLIPGKAARAGAEGSYAVGLVVAAAIASIIVVPLSVSLLGALFATPLRVQALPIARIVATGILLPLGIGIGIHALAPTLATRIAKPARLVASVVLVASLIPLLVTAWPAMRVLIGNGTLAAIIGMTMVGLAVGHLLGGPDRADRTVLALATATRHPAVAIAILSMTVPGANDVVAAVLLAVLVGALASTPYTLWSKRRSARRVAAPVHA